MDISKTGSMELRDKEFVKIKRTPCSGCGLDEFYAKQSEYSDLENMPMITTKEYHKKDCPLTSSWVGSIGTS